ncbi:MAG: repeat containing protein [Candidatus Solibacter sp.]|nr:repeat containing protein [Candidatus Solibacter sp.]
MRAPLLIAFCLACVPGSGQQIVTIAGAPHSHRTDVEGKDATQAPLAQVYGLLTDRVTGRLLIHDQILVERLEPDGTLLSMAGDGVSTAFDGSTADGIPTSALRIGILRGMAQDATGALYLGDALFGLIFRVARDGTVTRFAGGDIPALPVSDGIPARNVALGSPRGMVFDSKGNLDFADSNCRCIQRVDTAGLISTVYTLPPSATLTYFEGLAIDARDNLYAAEFAGHQVMKIAADGSPTTIAGTGVPGFSGDGGPATQAQLQGPSGAAVLPDGTLYIADTTNNRIRRITPDGIISTVAGTGVRGFSGDGGPAIDAKLALPAQVMADSNGDLLFTDFSTGHVRRISGGVITTVAGNGDIGHSATPGEGDGGPAIDAAFNVIAAIALDSAGNLYADELSGNRLRKIVPGGIVTTVGGTGLRGASGDGGRATQAAITGAYGIYVDAQNSIYLATQDSRIRKIDANGIVSNFAGVGTANGAVRSQGDGGPAASATLNEPKGVAVDATGNAYIADTSNARLRLVDRSGVIQTVAGPGQQGTDYWNAVAIDPLGDVFVGTTHAGYGGAFSQVQRLNADGSLTPVAGTGKPCAPSAPREFAYDGVQALEVPLCVVIGLTFDARGTMYISEPSYRAVLAMAPDGTLRRIAGSILAQSAGDAGPSLNASLAGGPFFSPGSVAVDAAGNVFIAQAGANRIREIPVTPMVLKLSQDAIEWAGRQSQAVGVALNIGGPIPYLVSIPVEASWLTANRAAGRTGEPVTLMGDPTGLAPGVYKATVTIRVLSTPALEASIAVTLTVK